MTKNELVALSDALRIHNQTADGRTEFTPDHLLVLANFCASQNPNFNRRRWIDDITGDSGPADELIFVEPDSTIIPGAIVEHKLLSNVNRDEGIKKSGKKRPSGPR